MARRNNQDWDSWEVGSGGFLLGALAGALVGAGVALLLAPKSGAQVRNEISSGFNTARDAAARRYRDLADKASQKLGYDKTPGDRFNGGATAASDSFASNPGTSGYQS
jgi:gas vesicle protein